MTSSKASATRRSITHTVKLNDLKVDHPPPEMREGCEAFISGWEDELVDTLVNRKDTFSAVHHLCHEVSQACQGVDPANVKPFDDTIMVDGQPQKMVRNFFILGRRRTKGRYIKTI